MVHRYNLFYNTQRGNFCKAMLYSWNNIENINTRVSEYDKSINYFLLPKFHWDCQPKFWWGSLVENGRFFPTEKKFRDKVFLDALDSKSSAVKTKNTIVVDSKKNHKIEFYFAFTDEKLCHFVDFVGFVEWPHFSPNSNCPDQVRINQLNCCP